MHRSLNPRTEALAYRIWAYCMPRGWDVTIPDLAAALDERVPRVRNVLTHKGWGGRVRSASSRPVDQHGVGIGEAERALIAEVVR